MKPTINIIGINWQCNSSACLMINGKIVGSVSEERFSKVKNDERYPKHAINHPGIYLFLKMVSNKI